jgi:2-oxoglutarate ferredoxin oxidoreductase subunit beta
VTVKTGHSLSELILSPRPIDYTGIANPRALVIVSPEGLAKSGRYLAGMQKRDRVFVLPDLPMPRTAASVTVVDGASAGVTLSRKSAALAVLVSALVDLDVLAAEALLAAAREDAPAHAAENLAAVEAGLAIARARRA